jgi:FkbM family methyltransferase
MAMIIEVGANAGDGTERLLDGGRNTVYAFEPHPEMASRLQARFKNRENFYLVPMAVDLEEGWRWFNAGRVDNSGISSLYEFSPDIGDRWPGVTFDHVDRFRVTTVRLDRFLEANRINGAIDNLSIKAQGNDFRVLKSLGDRIDQVHEGKCAAAYTVALYAGTDNDYAAIAAWLQERGFEVAVVPDLALKEADVHFRRRSS